MNKQELSAIVALLTDNTIHQIALADLLHKKGVISRVELGEHIEKFTKSYYEMIAERYLKYFVTEEENDSSTKTFNREQTKIPD